MSNYISCSCEGALRGCWVWSGPGSFYCPSAELVALGKIREERKGPLASTFRFSLTHKRRKVIFSLHHRAQWPQVRPLMRSTSSMLKRQSSLCRAGDLGPCRSKSHCWGTFVSRGEQEKCCTAQLLEVGGCRARAGLGRASVWCEVNIWTTVNGLLRLQGLFLGYLFTACTHFPVHMISDPLGFISAVLV